MYLKTFIFISVLSLGLVFGGLAFYIQNQNFKLISPILQASKLKVYDNVWFPKVSSASASISAPDLDISAKAAFFIDTDTGDVLFEKNSKERLSIASLTKIMTAIVTMENRTMDEILTVSERASGMEPDKMFLKTGETLKIRELLEGLFLVSANDAAEVLAEGVTGEREEFINLMNKKASMLGMKDSFFLNPSGLEEDFSKQYSTAFDVAVMSRYAIRNFPKLLEISATPHVYIEKTDTHQDYDLYSGINLLTTYPGVLGFKTGYTPEAGLTLVTVARRGDKEVLGVLLGSTSRREDAKQLLDFSFKKLGVETREDSSVRKKIGVK